MKLVATASIGLVLAAALPDALAVGWSLAGDTCADAIPVTTSNTLFNTSTHTDSGFPVEGHCWGMGTVSKDIWFSYTPPTDGNGNRLYLCRRLVRYQRYRVPASV